MSGTRARPAPAAVRRDADTRRLRRFLGGGLLKAPPAGVVVRRASSGAELLAAYRLVHDAFVAEGLLDPLPRGVRLRPCEVVPDTATFVAHWGERVVGVMSVAVDSAELGLPSDHVFGRELSRLRATGRRVVEITNLAVAPELRRTNVFFELTRAATAHVEAHGFDDVFVAVSPKHVPYFEQILCFEPWGDRRSYRTEALDPVQGLRLDLHGFEDALSSLDAALGADAVLHAWFYRDNPFFGSALADSAAAESRFSAEAVPEQLVGDLPAWLSARPEHEATALRRRWQRSGADPGRRVWQRARRTAENRWP